MNTLKLTVAIALTFILSACGGGSGGGGSAATTPTISAAQISITNTNAPNVAGATANPSLSSTGIGTTGASLIGGVSVNGTRKIGLAQFAEWQLTKLSKLPPQPANLVGAAVVSGSQACDGGGSFTYNYNDANNDNTLSIGETFSATLASCITMVGTAPVSGGMTLVMSSLTGTPGVGAWSGSLTMTFANFTMAAEQITGDITISLVSSNGSDISAALSGSSLSYTDLTGITILSGYSITVTYSNITNNYTIAATGTVSDAALNGTMSFSSSTVLAGNFNNNPDNPTSGVLLVTGANNSKLRVTALDNTNVQLAVDADGDGTYETTSTTTWAAITAL